MRKLLTSNLIAMVGTRTDSRFDVTESVPKLKELLIIQDISNSFDPSMDTTVTTKLYIPVWETDTDKYVPSLPSGYDDHYIKVSETKTTDQSTGDICLEISYNYYDRICYITFANNTNGDLTYGIRYSEGNIVVPYTSEMRIIPSYSTPQGPTSIQFGYDNTTREVTAMPEHESLYILGFTYDNAREDFINEGEGILIYDNTTLYGWQSSDCKMDVLLDCINGEFVDSSGPTVYCGKYTSSNVGITMNSHYTVLDLSRRNNSSISIDRIVPIEGYKVDAIEVVYGGSIIATISPNNIERGSFNSREYPGVLTVRPHIIVDPGDYNFDSEYHAFPNELWYSQGLGNDTAFLTLLNNTVQSYGGAIPSGAYWYCQTLQFIEKQKSCTTQNYSFWCILNCFDWGSGNGYVIAIDVTDLMGTYINWSPYQQQQSSLNSGIADQIKAKVSGGDLSVYYLSSYPPMVFSYENRYTCLVSDNPSQYEQLLSGYNDLKNGYIGGNSQLP